MKELIDDNLLASFSDGTATPLEQHVFGNKIQTEYSEVLAIAADIKECGNLIEKIEPVKINACEKFIIETKPFKDLKSDIDNHHNRLL
jgi:hypothetical protein